MEEEKCSPYYVGVDPIGVGAATVNELDRLTSYQVQKLNGGERPHDSTQKAPNGWLQLNQDANRFGNLQSQMWWQLRRDLEMGQISLPDDPQLIRELTQHPVSYVRNGKLHVEPKDQIRKRLGGGRAEQSGRRRIRQLGAPPMARTTAGVTRARIVLVTGRAQGRI